MSRLMQAPRVEVSATIKLTEQELRALDALVGYGDQPFLDAFYRQLGRHYMEPHEAGIRSLFAVIRADLNPILARANAAKTAFILRDPIIRSRADHEAMIKRLTHHELP